MTWMSRSISPNASRCCISARSKSKEPAARSWHIRARGRSILATDALLLADIDALYGDSHVLHRVSFRCGAGRLLGLLGRNGAGKTTSMNVAMGLLPPRHGSVEIYGTSVTGRRPEAIAAQGVALVPQGRRVFRSLTVRENLAVAARKPEDGLPMLWTIETVFATFPRLRERRDQYAGTLSGGEQ